MSYSVTSMYQSYFGLAEAPFSIAPDPRYLYLSHRHQEALATLLYGLHGGGGVVLLTGEVGAGKTTVCRCLIEQVPDNCDVAYIFNPRLTVVELLSTICDEFGIPYLDGDVSIKQYVDYINDYLLRAHAKGRNAVLIIDEAQNLSVEVLEQMRLLTNLETNQRKLLQIILLGQPELGEMLDRPELRQLAQRIVARYHLGPLTRAEVAAYVRHRLEMSGSQRQLFTPTILKQVYRMSGGVPRIINVLCDRALLGAFVEGKDRVSRATLAQAAREVLHRPVSSGRGRWLVPTGMALLLLGLVAAALHYTEPWLGEIAAAGPPANADVTKAMGQAKDERIAKVSGAAEVSKNEPVPRPLDQAAAVNDADPSAAAAMKATAPPGNVETVATLPDVLEWPDVMPRSRSSEIAFAALLQAWGVNASGDNACRQVEGWGLGCRSARGGLDDLKRLNRPAVLLMRDSQGREFQAALTKLGNRAAIFTFGNDSKEVSLDTLAMQWTGDYTILWRVPEGGREYIRADARGPSVEWLSRHLAQVHDGALLNSAAPVYGEALVRQVKQFQLSQGLIPDGVAGPQTLLYLSNLVDQAAPRLVEDQGGE